MPVIDAEGLFGGDRFDLCSDIARLYWPHIWCASNGLGRIEINYHKIVARAFSRFKLAPSQELLMGIMQEYASAWLLFPYHYRGAIWGQWDTSAKWLPRYVTATDNSSPEPPRAEFAEWRRKYLEFKEKSAKSNPFNNSQNISETFLHGKGKGVGVGVGVGDGKGLHSTSSNGHSAVRKNGFLNPANPDVDELAFERLSATHPGRARIRDCRAAWMNLIVTHGPGVVEKIQTSCERWAEYWRESGRAPTGMLNWLLGGDWEIAPPPVTKPVAYKSAKQRAFEEA